MEVKEFSGPLEWKVNRPKNQGVGRIVRDHLIASSDHNYPERRTEEGNRLWTVTRDY